jgi:hypothetical protein
VTRVDTPKDFTFDDVVVLRGGRRALNGFSAHIPGTGGTAVYGPSGSGKSALGQPSRRAANPYLRTALRSAVSPQIETTKATGLFFLPGAMTDLILAGVPPTQAVLVQAVVMFLILGAATTSTVVIALGLIRRLFTPDHRLVPLPAAAQLGRAGRTQR